MRAARGSDVAPVRVYDAFVEALNRRELGIIHDDHKVGNPEHDPKAMLKLLACGYSLERATRHNLSFIRHMAGLKPGHKTIAEFRRKNKDALKKALGLCAGLCVKLKLIEGNTLFADGAKMRA
ncbi:MAG: transposase, partial [Deltaproteobacteria bacterium]|nr:transposase [Deltaproteobacteria bacterium]